MSTLTCLIIENIMYLDGYCLNKLNFIIILIHQNTQSCSIFLIGMFMNVYISHSKRSITISFLYNKNSSKKIVR